MTRRALFVCLALMVACGPQLEEAELPVVRIDGSVLTRAELESYLAMNLASVENADPETDGDLIRSVLFESWVDERLVLDQAERHGIAIGNDQLDELLDDPSFERGEGDRDNQRRYLRERLLIELVQAEVLQTIVPPSVAELESAISDREQATPGRRVELRSLRFDSAETAQQVHRNLRRDRLTFNEAVVQQSEDESQGSATLVDLETLPPEVQSALEKLRPGWSSIPVEVGGYTYLFQVVSWQSSDAGERIEFVRAELYAARRREAWELYIAGLRAGAEIRPVTKNLPFRYLAGSAPDD